MGVHREEPFIKSGRKGGELKRKKITCSPVAFRKREFREGKREAKEMSPYFMELCVVLIFKQEMHYLGDLKKY